METQQTISFSSIPSSTDEQVTDLQVKCLNPRIILNPSAADLIARYKHYYLRGTRRDQPHPSHPWDMELFGLKPGKLDITHDDLSSCYVDTGDYHVPLYLEVPCGHCEICSNTKTNMFVQRMIMEAQCYDSKPWFVTLTYAPEFYRPPHTYSVPGHYDNYNGELYTDSHLIGGVNVRDCQLFLKQLRINLERAGFKDKIRYVLSAEYGQHPVSGEWERGHYHIVLYGIRSFDHQQYLKVQQMIEKSWHRGFVKTRLVDTESDYGLFYTVKYAFKGSDCPDGCVPPFTLSSRGNGGIGSQFIDKHAKRIRKTLNTEYKYKDRFSGKVRAMPFCNYVLNRIVPSFCKLVPSACREAVQHIVACVRALIDRYGEFDPFGYFSFSDVFQGMDSLRDFVHRFEPYFCTGFYCKPLRFIERLTTEHLHLEFEDSLFKFWQRPDLLSPEYLDYAKRSNSLRHKFIAKLLAKSRHVDLEVLRYSIVKRQNYKSSYAVLS